MIRSQYRLLVYCFLVGILVQLTPNMAKADTRGRTPVITSIQPNQGSEAGGAEVTIKGENFRHPATLEVNFNGTPAVSVTLISRFELKCVTPGHEVGIVDVTVRSKAGKNTLKNGYEYYKIKIPLNIDNVAPENGPLAGGTLITMTGNGFTTSGDTTITIDGNSANNIVVVDSNTMTCETPAVTKPGLVDVYVANSNGYDTLVDGFTYNHLPEISSVSPSYGSADGGTPITISGSYFTTTGDTIVKIGGSAALNMVVINASTITCVTPVHASGTVGVTITNSNGSTINFSGFTYYAATVISSVAPNTGSINGGQSITISGGNYTGLVSTIVSFGGVAATNVVVQSETSITCTTPAHIAGVIDVSVSNDFGSDTLANGFTYEEQTASISDLTYVKNGDSLELSWTLSSPADQIVIYRGGNVIDTIAGDSTSYSYIEGQYGYFRFSVELKVGNSRKDIADVLADFGKSTWDAPSKGNVTGYYVYIAEAVGVPATVLPYSNPSSYSYDAGLINEISLKTLYDACLIKGGQSYYIALSTYYIEGSNTLISSLTDSLTLDYHVDITMP